MERGDNSATELDLVRRAQEGDHGSFTRLIERHEERLHALVSLRLGSRLRQRLDVEDALQETYMRAWSTLQQFEWRGHASFFHWLAGIAEHVVTDLKRHHIQTQKRNIRRERSLDESDSDGGSLLQRLAASGTSPDRKLQRKERLERLEEALERLSDEHREVIILARIRGLSIAEIAERMGRSRDAVSMLLYRAARRLREFFESTGSIHLTPSGLAQLLSSRQSGDRTTPGDRGETARSHSK